MTKLNDFQWTSQEVNGVGSGVGAERLRAGVRISVTNGNSWMGFNLTTRQADDLAKFLIDCGIAERTAPEPTEEPTEGEPIDELFGRRMACQRERIRMTQNELARAMRMRGHRWTQQTVALVESGRRQMRLAEAVDGASLLGHSVEFLARNSRGPVPDA